MSLRGGAVAIRPEGSLRAPIQNRDSSDSDLLERREVVLVLWLKFQKLFANYFSNLVAAERSSANGRTQ